MRATTRPKHKLGAKLRAGQVKLLEALRATPPTRSGVFGSPYRYGLKHPHDDVPPVSAGERSSLARAAWIAGREAGFAQLAREAVARGSAERAAKRAKRKPMPEKYRRRIAASLAKAAEAALDEDALRRCARIAKRIAKDATSDPEPPRHPTPQEVIAREVLSRIMSPDEWAEFDAGKGTCTNMAGWEIGATLKAAARVIKAYPAIADLVAPRGL